MQSFPNTVGVCREWGSRYDNYRKHCPPRAGGTEKDRVTGASGLRGASMAPAQTSEWGRIELSGW